jgi:hypothetical protein
VGTGAVKLTQEIKLWKTTMALNSQGHCYRTLQGISFLLQVTNSNDLPVIIKAEI